MAHDFLYTCLQCGLRWVNAREERCLACLSPAIHARALEFGELPEEERTFRLKEIQREYGIWITSVY